MSRPATPRRQRPGFSLVELVIVVMIIGALAAVAIPRLSRGARTAGASALKSDLAQLRNAIELYAAEHDGKYPGASIADQLTKYTNITGGDAATTIDSAAGRVYGPYLKDIPPLPVGARKGATGIHVATTGGPPGGTDADGWFYNSTTFEISANIAATDVDDDGVAYNSY